MKKTVKKSKVKKALAQAKKIEKKPIPTSKDLNKILEDLKKQEERLHRLMHELSHTKVEKNRRKKPVRRR
jgi:hypothetical protein